jgi:hypothetical protein
MAVAKALGDFEFQQCTAWKEIAQRLSENLRVTHVRSLAWALCMLFPDNLPKLTRTESRRFSPIIKWFDDNWVLISQVIPFLSFADENLEPVTLARLGINGIKQMRAVFVIISAIN